MGPRLLVFVSYIIHTISITRVHPFLCVCNDNFDKLVIHDTCNFSTYGKESTTGVLNLLGVAKEGECLFYNGTEVIKKSTYWKTDIKGKTGWISLDENNGLRIKNCSDPLRDVKEGSNCLHLLKPTQIYREPRISDDVFNDVMLGSNCLHLLKPTQIYREPLISDDVFNDVMLVNECNTLTDCPNLVFNEPFKRNNNSWYNVTYNDNLLNGYILADDAIRWHCKDLDSYRTTEKTYALKPWEIVIIASAPILVLAVSIIFRILHKRRKSHQERKNLYKQYNESDGKTSRTEYDVFISYSRDDLDWVQKELFTRLRDEGFNVCIDFKDFIPGMDVSENILTGIYASKKTIVIMSENFLRSVWGQFELHHAHYKAIIKRKDTLILIKYGKCKVPRRLMGKTFLDWTCYKERPYFWKRLFQSISAGNQKTRESMP